MRMANLLMHPRADSLTFLFTTQSGCEGKEMREGVVEGWKIATMCCFSFNHSIAVCLRGCRALQGAIHWFLFQTVEQNKATANLPVWTLFARLRYTFARRESAS